MAIDVAKVVMHFKADVKDAKNQIRQLSDEQKKQAKVAIDAMEKQNDSIDKSIAMWGKLAVGIGAATGAVMALQKGYETYEKNTRLRAANVNTDIEGLRKATRGLVDDTRLLEFSAKAMNGTWALSQRQTEDVLQAALALRKTAGVDLPEAMRRVEQAVNEANAEALKPLGITIRETTGTAEAQKAILGALSDQYRQLGGDVGLAGDEMKRANTSFANTMDEASEALGRLAAALAPVVQLLADAINGVASLSKYVRTSGASDMLRSGAGSILDEVSFFLGGERGAARRLGITGTQAGYAQKIQQDVLAQYGAAGRAALGHLGRGLGGIVTTAPGGAAGAGAAGRGGGGGRVPATLDLETRLAMAGAINDAAQREAQQRAMASFQAGANKPIGDMSDAQAVALADIARTQEQLIGNMNASARARRESMLEQMFGPIDQFNMYASAFGMLESATAAAFNAWIDGSKGVAEAFKQSIGASVQALASEMMVQALRHTAYGIGALAFGPVAGASAAGHFKAAAGFGAGAVAAGLVAKQLGGSGVSVGAGPAVAGLGGGGGAGGPQKSTTVYIIGEGMGELSDRQRAALAKRTLRTGGVTFEGDVVEFS